MQWNIGQMQTVIEQLPDAGHTRRAKKDHVFGIFEKNHLSSDHQSAVFPLINRRGFQLADENAVDEMNEILREEQHMNVTNFRRTSAARKQLMK